MHSHSGAARFFFSSTFTSFTRQSFVTEIEKIASIKQCVLATFLSEFLFRLKTPSLKKKNLIHVCLIYPAESSWY